MTSEILHHLNTQCFMNDEASLELQSPFGFCFCASHHASLPTAGAHPDAIATTSAHKNPKSARCFI